jgi:yeast amino acid transporter
VYLKMLSGVLIRWRLDRGALGTRYWSDPGSVKNLPQSMFAIVRIANMAYGGTEIVTMTAAESSNPVKSMPLAAICTTIRFLIFYLVPLFLLGLVVPSDNPLLATIGHGAKFSPFTLSAQLAGLGAFAHLYNVLIIVALLSMVNCASYSSTRALNSLAEQGMAPAIFKKMRNGVPVWAVAVCIVTGSLAWVKWAPSGDEIFDWLLSFSSTSVSSIFVTSSLAHIRMRSALRKRAGRDDSELAWRSPLGAVGSWIALIFNLVTWVFAIAAIFLPVGGVYDVKGMIRDSLGLAVLISCYIGWKIRMTYVDKEPFRWFIPLDEIDLDTGKRAKA